MQPPSDPPLNSSEADLAAAFALDSTNPDDQIQAESLIVESEAFSQRVHDYQSAAVGPEADPSRKISLQKRVNQVANRFALALPQHFLD